MIDSTNNFTDEIVQNTVVITKIIQVVEMTETPYKQYIEPIINDINLIKDTIDDYFKVNVNYSKNTLICVKTNNKLFQLNLPIFTYILYNPTNTQIPIQLLKNYTVETNYSAQTPLMLAAVVNNFNYVQQLIQFDIGKIDEYNKSALDYAIEFQSSDEIIDLLSQFELS